MNFLQNAMEKKWTMRRSIEENAHVGPMWNICAHQLPKTVNGGTWHGRNPVHILPDLIEMKWVNESSARAQPNTNHLTTPLRRHKHTQAYGIDELWSFFGVSLLLSIVKNYIEKGDSHFLPMHARTRIHSHTDRYWYTPYMLMQRWVVETVFFFIAKVYLMFI